MSIFGQKVLKLINPLFPKQVHPFNLQANKEKTYAQWEYEKGKETIKFYLDKFTIEEMFKGKDVIDLGCGSGGKSVYYASLGANKVTGIDIIPEYEKDSLEFAKEKGFSDKFSFIKADATKLPFNDNTFDVAIMNDFIEHVKSPKLAIQEALRVLKTGGYFTLTFLHIHILGEHIFLM